MTKLYASGILITRKEMPCQVRDEQGLPCGKPTYFAVPGQYVVIERCPEHLYPLLRKGQQDRLFYHLGSAIYAMSLHDTTQLLSNEHRCWPALSLDEQEAHPLASTIASILTEQPEMTAIPLCEWINLLSMINAQAAVSAMGGKEWLEQAIDQQQALKAKKA